MATTSKATTPKKTTAKPKAAETAPDASTALMTSQIAALQAQVETLTAQVTNLNATVSGGAKDTDGDGIADVAGLTVRVQNIVNFLKRKWGEGPIENSGVY